MTVFYEWDVETHADGNSPEHADGEVIDHHFCASFKEAILVASRPTPPNFRWAVVLVRDDDDRRSWAYLAADSKLPSFFSDSGGVEYARVPKRFLQQTQNDTHPPHPGRHRRGLSVLDSAPPTSYRKNRLKDQGAQPTKAFCRKEASC